ncbi:MAG: hypothetical protein AVDCRST_MAG35-2706 [uncultured Quadrisphaera sp.]|uniref:Transcriptional regulator, AcrR family n=1 Tax=uncultured Quadrisphaera sp. TaxID=904978 RepID=A0A6J4QAP9_9ACTN|nr:MAG: hypothetical protein AVDCRST_MAG35-2706 [uncultured Quadrisphaera sp.]
MSRAFAQAVFAGWSPAELASLPAGAVQPGTGGSAGAPGGRTPELPAGAVAALVDGWAGLHGVVVLELLGHLDWTGASGEDTCRDVLLRYADRLAAARATGER